MEKATGNNKAIRSAIFVSRINGWSVTGFAALCAVIALVMGSLWGGVIGAAVALSGLMELQGNRLLQKGEASAVRWLAFSQVYLIGVLWIYAIQQLITFDSGDPWARFSPEFKEFMLNLYPDVYLVEDLLKVTYLATYISLMVAVLIYQGGLGIYYLSRKKYLYAGGR